MNVHAWSRAAVAGCLLVLTGLVGAPANAAGETNIDYVEASPDNTVSVILGVDGLPESPELDSLTVEVNGEAVDAQAQPLQEGQIRRTTVLALDSSLSMSGDRFAAAKSAAKAFLEAAPADVRVGLLTFSGEIHDVTEPTLDHAALVEVIDDIDLTLGTQLYDAVVRAVDLAGEEGARSVLLLSDGEDDGNGAALDAAVEAASGANTVVDVVAVQQAEDTRALLAQIADASGGKVIAADDPSALAEHFTAQGEALASQVLVTFPRTVNAAEEVSIAVSVRAAGEIYTDSAFVRLSPVKVSTRLEAVQTQAPLVDERALWVGAAGLGLGLAVVLATVFLRTRKSPTLAERQLAYYSGGAQPGRINTGAGADAPASPSLRASAVSLTERMVEGDFETRLAQRLSGAGVAFTAAEWLLLHAGIAVGAAFAGLVLGGAKLMVILFIAGAVVPWIVLRRKHKKRLAAFNAQLAETLQLISGGLSAGLSLPQGVDTVVREGQEPMAGELRRALMEARLGVDIEEALDGVAERMESEDFSWVVMAIRIQREVGGNLAELLNTVSDTLRERDYLRRQVRVLSAEGRISAYVLGGLPIVMFLYMLLVRPDAIRPLYTEPLGMVMAATAILMLVLGFFSLSKLVKVEV